MKRAIALITLLTLITNFYGQDHKSVKLSFNIGSSVSNLQNSDPAYRHDDYGRYIPIKTDLIKDVILGITLNGGIEYFINNKSSISSGLFYEKKGVFINYDSSFQSNITDLRYEYTFVKKIKNHYLTIPLTIRRYFYQERSLFIEAGFYGGILFLSQSYFKEVTYVQYGNGDPSTTEFEFRGKGGDNHTTKFDFGLTFGTGYKKAISDRISFISNLKLNFGLRKIDAINSNEVIYTPSGIHLTSKTIKNYYGLNSFARNINLTLTFGIVYKVN